MTTAQAEGLGGVPDPDVLAGASAAGRAVLTHDRDFIRLHRASSAHGAIVHCSVDTDAAALAGRIDAALTGAALAGQLLRVYRPATP